MFLLFLNQNMSGNCFLYPGSIAPNHLSMEMTHSCFWAICCLFLILQINDLLYKEIKKFIGWFILRVCVAVVLNMQSEYDQPYEEHTLM